MNDRTQEKLVQIVSDAYDLRGAALLARMAVENALSSGDKKGSTEHFQTIKLIEEQIDGLTFAAHDLVGRAERLIAMAEALSGDMRC